MTVLVQPPQVAEVVAVGGQASEEIGERAMTPPVPGTVTPVSPSHRVAARATAVVAVAVRHPV